MSERIVTYAIHNDYIKQEQYDEYSYALNMVLNILFTDITMLFIGCLMHMIWECIVFWLAYKILRKYCGGFHFSTSLKCYLSSCVMCPIVLWTIRYIPYDILIWSVITAAALAVLFIFAPVAAVNKPLDEKETLIFGKIARLLILLMAMVYAAVTVSHLYIASKVIALSIICVMLFVIAGKIHLLYQKKNI